MNESLTTGQMIDKLKRGEVAVGVSGFYEGTKLEKTECGEILYAKRNKPHSINNFFELNCYTENAKWRILPIYVSFEEAMKAMKEGKGVRWFSPDGGDSVVFRPRDYKDEDATAEFSWQELIEGKWTIVEEETK